MKVCKSERSALFFYGIKMERNWNKNGMFRMIMQFKIRKKTRKEGI